MTDTSVSQQPHPRAVRRGRIIALLLFVIAFLPIVLATAMYFGGWGATGGTANKGELIQPVGAVSEFGFSDPQGQPLGNRFHPATEEPQWLVLTLTEDCGQACQSALHETRQVHIALGRERDRVERALWTPGIAPDQLADYPELMQVELAAGKALPDSLPGSANLAESYQIYVIDPNGNVILRYDNGNSGEDLLDDLKKLLRLSNIG
jgi:cytochrome oxidase Cu insertion factor (SCO1/SenC/PrrC family)